MTIPVYVLGAISLSAQVYFSDRLKKRGVFIVSCCAPVAAGYLMCVFSKNPDVGYAGMFVLVVGKFCRMTPGGDLLIVLTRLVPHLDIGCHLDHNKFGTGHQACDRPAIRI
jgi:hypothetical protein